MNIRRLSEEDAPAWRELRIRMLRDHPEAFGEHVDDFLARPIEEVVAHMVEGNIFGAFDAEQLVGAAGWHDQKGRKRAHIGVIWGMYVAPEARRKNLGRKLIEVLLAEIRASGRDLAELSVAESNIGARKLYEATGFREWGREPDALRVESTRVTEIHMSRPT